VTFQKEFTLKVTVLKYSLSHSVANLLASVKKRGLSVLCEWWI